MYPWRFLPLVVFGMLTLSGCDRLGDDQEQVTSRTPAGAQPTLVQAAEVEELAADEEVAWLDEPVGGAAREIDWNELIPEDWRPETLMSDVDIDDLSDDDPRAQQLLDKLKVLWSQAPVVSTLEGQRVRLPGFIVPLEMDAESIDEFLLVPYYGACIHVPPPPANQTVHVVTGEDQAFEGQLFDVVWVTGTIRVERLSTDLGDAGYRFDNASVTPYE